MNILAEEQNVWEAVASATNITPDNAHLITYAQDILIRLKNEDFQRRF